MALTVEQLLATLGIDLAAVEVSATGRYVLIQRDPQPSEQGIGADTEVEFVLVDLDGDPTDATLPAPDFDVTIEGDPVLSYSGGVPTWTAPWSGTVTTHTIASPFAFWKVAASHAPLVFESEQEVNVQVDLTATGGWGHGPWGHFPWGHSPPGPVVTSFQYVFYIEDLTPPSLIAAEGIDPHTVRVTFDDDMATTGAGSVLDLANWTAAFQRWNVDPLPGVTLEAVAIAAADAPALTIPVEWTYADEAARLAATGFTSEEIGQIAFQESDSTYWQLIDIAAVLSGGYGGSLYGHFLYGHTPTITGPAWRQVTPATQWDITVNWEQTPGCRYQITAGAAIEDDNGNAMDPVFNTTDFDGFTPEPVEGRAFSHWRHMVPLKNRIEDATRDLERTSNCIEEVLGWMLYYVDRFTDQWDPDKATDEQIAAMLYDMGNPFAEWTELDLTPTEQRKLLRILIEIYKSKGTAWGIEQTVFFLLGEVVTCVEYAAGGWILGVDALGSGAIAEVMSAAWDTWDFTLIGAPWQLEIVPDGTAPETITFVPGDFADPTAVTAAEVAAVIVAQGVKVGAYPTFPGQPAVVEGTNLEPFAISPGDTLDLSVNGGPLVTITFATEDIATPGAATAAEIAARVTEDLAGEVVGYDDGGALAMETVVRGALGSLQVSAGVVQGILGLPITLATGTDHGQVAVYSNKAGVEASVQVTGGSVNAALLFDTAEVGSTGGAVLAPSDSYTLYSFDIETENMLTSEQQAIVRRVAEYMKPAHTHLIDIRTADPLPWPDAWMLGIDELDVSAELGE